MTEMYRRRRDVFCEGLARLGWRLRVPDATFYVWLRAPDGYTSAAAVARLLEEANVVTTPGNGFGATGEGYVRAALTVGEARIAEAVDRIGKIAW